MDHKCVLEERLRVHAMWAYDQLRVAMWQVCTFLRDRPPRPVKTLEEKVLVAVRFLSIAVGVDPGLSSEAQAHLESCLFRNPDLHKFARLVLGTGTTGAYTRWDIELASLQKYIDAS